MDAALSRAVDLLLSMPSLIFAFVVLSVLGTEVPVLVVTLACLDSTRVFRLSRALAMNIVALADGAQGAVINGTQGRPIYPGRGAGLLLGVRPEDIELAASGVAAAVEAVEYLGADSILACSAGSEALIVRAQGKVAIARGTEVQLAWHLEAIHIFDAASGVRRDDVLAAAKAAA